MGVLLVAVVVLVVVVVLLLLLIPALILINLLRRAIPSLVHSLSPLPTSFFTNRLGQNNQYLLYKLRGWVSYRVKIVPFVVVASAEYFYSVE